MLVKEKCMLYVSYENIDAVQEGNTVHLFLMILLLL